MWWKSTKVPKGHNAVEDSKDWNNLFAEVVDDTLKQIQQRPEKKLNRKQKTEHTTWLYWTSSYQTWKAHNS